MYFSSMVFIRASNTLERNIKCQGRLIFKKCGSCLHYTRPALYMCTHARTLLHMHGYVTDGCECFFLFPRLFYFHRNFLLLHHAGKLSEIIKSYANYTTVIIT